MDDQFLTKRCEVLEGEVRRLTLEREQAYHDIGDLYMDLRELCDTLPRRGLVRALLTSSATYSAEQRARQTLRKFDNHPAFY